jgi:small subunit ribosomal protein S6
VRSYELIYIVHPEVDEAGLSTVNETVTGLVERGGGKVVKIDPWGLRRLAYPIQKMWEGQYVLMHLELDPQSVTELERGLGLAEQILRHLVVRLEEVESAGVTAKPVETVEQVAVAEPTVEAAEVEDAEAEQAEPAEAPSEPSAE